MTQILLVSPKHGFKDQLTNRVYIAGYNFIFKKRSGGCHGGVGLYIKNSISFKCLDHLQHPVLEVLWVRLTPKRLPRGFPCLVIGVIYHPRTLTTVKCLVTYQHHLPLLKAIILVVV